ncbi:MAG TPA: phosphatase PAP2 family protein [Polyangiaceae bacterium]|nr:phosphatase PAP2 family protein [Polyangiaceae bacterium]
MREAVPRPCLCLSFSLAVFAVLWLGSPSAVAQTESAHRLSWHSDWRRVNGVEYAITSSLFATFMATWFLPPLEDALWTRPVFLDRSTRRALRARTRQGRNTAGAVSDALAALSYLPPLLIDPMLVAGVEDQNPDVAWQLFVISTQSYAITVTLNHLSKRIFARQRPYAFACTREADYSDDCENADRFRSFYSGHSAVTATSAGLICAHHTHVPLYGGANYDRLTCAAALAGMFTTGALRMVADKHWNSDVLVGHLLGFSVGYLLPTLVYYKSFQSKPDRESGNVAALSPRALPTVLTTEFTF